MIDLQKKQFEDWWDTQWIRFDSDRETINERKSCARDGFEFGLSTVWTEVERLKKELEDTRQPEVTAPAAHPRDPKVLVNALERITDEYYGEEERGIAREALAAWKGGLP